MRPSRTGCRGMGVLSLSLGQVHGDRGGYVFRCGRGLGGLFVWACLGLSGLESSVCMDPKKSAKREAVVCCSRTGVRFGGWAGGTDCAEQSPIVGNMTDQMPPVGRLDWRYVTIKEEEEKYLPTLLPQVSAL